MEKSVDASNSFNDSNAPPNSDVIDMVHEFLLKFGYFKSLDAFQEEIFNQHSLEGYIRSAPGNSRFGKLLLLEVTGANL